MLGTDIAIDLGTASVKIYLDGKGIVLNEPAMLAYDEQADKVLAVGNEAYAMLGRTSDRISVIQPLVTGGQTELCLPGTWCKTQPPIA